jgi:hypothetical protein
MNAFPSAIVIGFFIRAVSTVAQGTLSNFNFESAPIPPGSDFRANAAVALPGWTVLLNNKAADTIFYNDIALSSYMVSIHDSSSPMHPISGLFSVYLQGGFGPFSGRGPAALAQIRTIPTDANSLLFSASPNISTMEVSFRGSLLPYYPIESRPSFTIYAADLSGLANQSGELRFSTPFGTSSWLDDISFSPIIVPEPAVITLAICGGLAVLYTARRRG